MTPVQYAIYVGAPPIGGEPRVPPLAGFEHAPGYPGGPSDVTGAALTNGVSTVVESDTTYNFYRNLGGYGEIGLPSAPVHNVTFNGCMWENDGLYTAAVMLRIDGPVTFNNCTIRPTGLSNSTAPVGQVAGYQYGVIGNGTVAVPGTYNSFAEGPATFNYCHIWGYANAVMHQGSTQTTPHSFNYCYVHNSRTNDNTLDHVDGIGLPAGGSDSYVTIDHCWITDVGDTQGIAYQNTPGPSTYDHFTITNNVISGWGFGVNLSGGTAASPNGGTNITFEDNTFSTAILPIYGPLYSSLIATGTGNSWRRNTWWVPEGAAWGDPAHDGWFWLPNSSNIIGTDDTPYVSLTDFAG